jgi:hypothetical protein
VSRAGQRREDEWTETWKAGDWRASLGKPKALRRKRYGNMPQRYNCDRVTLAHSSITCTSQRKRSSERCDVREYMRVGEREEEERERTPVPHLFDSRVMSGW